MGHPLEGKRTPLIALRCGDATSNEQSRAADALESFAAISEFVLSDSERGLAFVQWQRAKGLVCDTPEKE